MSYQIKIEPRSRKAGRFIYKVHKEIQKAFVSSGMKQNDLAKKLGVDRSAINKQLQGKSNLTLRSIADLAWAMDCDLNFSIKSIKKTVDTNHFRSALPLTRTSLDPNDAVKPLSSVFTTTNSGEKDPIVRVLANV